MPIDPKNYAWLDRLAPLPRMIAEARKLLGIVEVPGKADSPIIMGWADELGGAIERAYTADAVPWCGLFLAIVAKRAGKAVPDEPLWALNWGNFGERVAQPGLGDVLTFQRPGGGHVALYIGEDKAAYHVLGGNQSDQVCYARIAKIRLRAARRPAYVAKPATAKPYILAATGALSRNEA